MRKTKNYPVKNSVDGRQGTMLFSEGRVRLKSNQSKIALSVNCSSIFLTKIIDKNQPVKNSVRYQVRMLFSQGRETLYLFFQGRVTPQITESKMMLMVHSGQCHFPLREQDCKSPVKHTINDTKVECYCLEKE